MPKKHSRVRLTWEQKRAICKLYHEQSELPVRDLCAWAAKEFALSSPPAPGTLRLLFKSLIQDGGGNSTRKAHYKVQCALLEAEVVQRIDSCEQLRILVVTGATICAKAAMIRDRIVGDPSSNVTSKPATMVFSDRWLRKLKLRHGIKFRRLHGEAASASATAVAEGRVQLQEITREYDKCDVFNMDETAYFYCMPPDHSHSKNPIAGAKKDKKRITMAVTSNADGSAKVPLLFIGTARQPRCFNGRTGEQLGHQYYSAAKGWMATSLFQQWVHEFNAAMQKERRNVLLLLDNASCHRIEQPLSNARIQMLPPNTTAHLQPQGAGAIQSLKARIRAIKTRRVVVKVDELLERAAEVGVESMQAVTKSFFSADVLEAMEWAEEAWKGVTSKTVANCWRHTAILDEDLCALIISMRGLRQAAALHQREKKKLQAMDVQYDGQHALAAAANGDFPLVVLLWGMAMAAQPAPADLLALTDADGNGILHYAAAGAVDSTDTLHFLLQQAHTSGRDLLVFVDCRNAAQETPLIRAAHAGNLRIVDALLNAGRANVLSKDVQGNTPAHHAAAQGHLWVLHYLLEYEKRTFAVKDAPLSTLGGKCNNKRDLLYYACMKEHKAIVQYLLKRGYDPNQPDADGATCLDLAQQKDAPWMVDLLSGEKVSSEEAPSSFRETRITIALLYTGLIFAILSTSYFFPWWLAVPLILVVLTKSLAGFRHGGGSGHSHGAPAKNPESLHPSKRDAIVAASVELTKTQVSGRSTSTSSAFTIKSLLKPQPEMPMGIWLAWVSLFTLFYIVLWVDSDYKSISTKYTAFLVVILVFHVIMVAIWLRLAFFCPSDPGVVASYHDDIDQMLRDAADGIPLDIATYCRTCLVLKPMRSKHCAKCGVCIARLDHHCTWINRCVGYGNHRIFVIFLLLHTTVLFGYVSLAMIVIYEKIQDLYDIQVSLNASSSSSDSGSENTSTSMDSMDVWTTIPAFISNYFLVVMVFIWGLLAFIALLLMTKQHLVNLMRNLTVNEEINWRRYAYLTGKSNGTSASGAKNVVFSNPFDRGVKKNVKEFFSRSGKEIVDYRKIFKAPSERGFATVPEAHRAESKDIHFRGVDAV